MRALKTIGKYFWRFMIVFSFIVNIILVVVLLVLGLTIFDIKKNIAQPLIQGLHSSFVGLNDATIDWTIPVQDTISVDRANAQLETTIPINLAETVVTLTQPVPLTVGANITAPGLTVSGASVSLTLPAGTRLPVSLAFDLPVQQDVTVSLDVPVDLKVRAVIPLDQTQIHDPVENLRLLFEPLVRALGNLPGDFSEVGTFAGQILSGNAPNLLAETPYSQNPWPGYSTTAGTNYTLGNAEIPADNVASTTGIVPIGGIPALDEGIRPELYQNGSTPATLNQQTINNLIGAGVNPAAFNGSYADTANSPSKQGSGQQPPTTTDTTNPPITDTGDTGQQPTGEIPATPIPGGGDLGIVATPGG
ncbi:MAG: hypothetical protein LCI00_20710 [Chloroflexi bacterium]|nr:hypothetical protein [Chloroflexota bacterium]